MTGRADKEESKEGEEDNTENDSNVNNTEVTKEDEEGGTQLGRKARKKASRLSVAELKQLVARPDVVEAHDITSADPR